MNLFSIILMVFLISSCATRRKVFFNKTTGDRWITVDNSAEFLTTDENKFLVNKN